jgi:hypothetical protein
VSQQQPRTAAGRDLMESYGLLADTIYRKDPLMVQLLRERILAIEQEAGDTAIWNALEAQPGFNEELAEGKAQIAAGHGTPFREARAEPEALLAAAKALIEPDDTVQMVIGSLNGVPARFLVAPEQLFHNLRAALAGASDPAEALLRDLRRSMWHQEYNVPGRGRAVLVARIDAYLGEPSAWVDRYFAQQYGDDDDALRAYLASEQGAE